jgi:hypothetical protein
MVRVGRLAGYLNWRKWLRLGALLVAICLLGRYLLGDLRKSEQDYIMEVLDQAAAAVEKESLLSLQSLVSENYRDSTGLDKSNLLRMAVLYFQNRDKTSILRLHTVVTLGEAETAQADMRVQIIELTDGMPALGGNTPSLLGDKFIVTLKKESGKWKISAVDPESTKWGNGTIP